jgi:hypothetical protein
LRVEFEDARPYHPNMDSIVRSEARRLRSKLKEYYESPGKDDPVFIYYRLGSYVPVFGFTAVGQEPHGVWPLWMHPAAIYLAHAPKSLPMN